MFASTPTAPAPSQEPACATLAVTLDGGLVRLRISPYHPPLVEQVKMLAGRRFIRERGEWIAPARRENLAELAELCQRLGEHAQVDPDAQRALARCRRGRIEHRDGRFELHFTPRPRLLAAVRALPDRRFLPDRRCWQVAATRAGALALLSLLDDGLLGADTKVTRRLHRLSAANAGTPPRQHSSDGEPRRSPIVHWRHVTRGPVFDANPDRREWVAGVGRCVRIRVTPRHPPDKEEL